MRGNSDMILTVVMLASLHGIVHSSGVHQAAPVINGPVVTATSSQYFQQNFNRLVAAPAVVPIVPEPPVFVQPAQALPVPVHPQHAFPVQPVPAQPVQPVQPVAPVQPIQPIQPVEPNVAIAIATANAAAPVATILLPPYPFGPPPTFGFVPQPQPDIDESRKESTTTTQATTQVEIKTTTREPEATTPIPASSNNNFVQALPSNQNVNFRQYLAPPFQSSPQFLPSPQIPNQHLAQPKPEPLPHHHHHHHHPHGHLYYHAIVKPQKLKTSVEVVKVPLAYIAPPAIPQYPHNHEAVKVVKHVHTFLPHHAKFTVRPVSHKSRIVPAKLIAYGAPARITAPRQQYLHPSKKILS